VEPFFAKPLEGSSSAAGNLAEEDVVRAYLCDYGDCGSLLLSGCCVLTLTLTMTVFDASLEIERY
jgi:hypothetical protein